MEKTFSELLDSSRQMLLDRTKEEQNLIYAVCKLDDEERAAIIMAYRFLYEEEKVDAKV